MKRNEANAQMERKALSGIILTLLLIGILTLTFNVQLVEASGTIYIKADGSVDPPTAPILNIGNVYYAFTDDIYESIVVQRNNIIVDGNGYTLQGPGVEYGFYLYGINNVTIQNTNIKGFRYGIRLYWSSNNNISGNNITNNEYGIVLSYSSSNRVSGNNIANNSQYGMWLIYFSNYNSISGNNITANNGLGIWLWWSSNHNNISSNNIAANNVFGIGLYEQSNYNSILGNNIANNQDGIRLDYSSNNSVSENNIANNSGYGVWLDYSSNYNSILGNYITNNAYGIRLGELSSNNAIYHNNFINNIEQLIALGSGHAWDDGAGRGNYWSDYMGEDLDGDGVGETLLPHLGVDYYPLMGPWMIPQSPTAKFTYSPPNPWAGDTVTFNVSGSTPGWNGTHLLPIVSYEWNFGDGNITTTSGPMVTHKYTMNNTYTATLNVTDGQGLWSTTSKTITVLIEHGPTAKFTYSPPFPRPDLPVTFNASPSEPGWNGTHGMPIVNYTWNFGDGNITSTSDPIIIHNYTVGTYIVTLNVTDTRGFWSITFQTITVCLAEFSLVTLYEVYLDLDYWLSASANLTAVFYTYVGVYQGNTIVWSGATPTRIVLSTNITHPQGKPIEIVKLVLTDNSGNITQTVRTFVVHRPHLMERLATLDAGWIYSSPAERTAIFKEIIEIDMQWPYA